VSSPAPQAPTALAGILSNLHALIGIHLLAALWHQFVRRERLLQRMWPQQRRARAADRSRIRASRP
jgi:cytochrome b561